MNPPHPLDAAYVTAFETARDSIVITDADFANGGPHILAANSAFTRLTGYDLSEVVGRSPRFLQGRRTDRSVLDRLKARLLAGESFHGETYNYRKDGSEFLMEWTIEPVRMGGGSVQHFVGIQRDVTDLRRLQNQALAGKADAQVIINSIRDHAVIVVDGQSNVLSWSLSATSLLGGSQLEMKGRSCRCIYPAEEAESRHLSFIDAIRRYGTYAEEGWMCRVDGSRFWAQSSTSLLRTIAGEDTAYVKVIRDRTEWKRHHDETARVERERRQNEKLRALGTLAAGIAHDLNNLLGAIRCNADLLGVEKLSRLDRADAMTRLVSAIDLGTAFTSQILGFARDEPLKLVPLEFAEVVRGALNTIRPTIHPHIELSIRIDQGLPMINGDASRLHQVIFNLCKNATQAMQRKPGRLSIGLSLVRLQTSDSEPRHLCLSIKDTGTGMESHVIERAFDPFFTTRPSGVGSGLGLAVVQGIVLKHGGEITIESRLGEGSTFRVFIPTLSADQPS